jgi:hypothetical protein
VKVETEIKEKVNRVMKIERVKIVINKRIILKKMKKNYSLKNEK